MTEQFNPYYRPVESEKQNNIYTLRRVQMNYLVSRLTKRMKPQLQLGGMMLCQKSVGSSPDRMQEPGLLF